MTRAFSIVLLLALGLLMLGLAACSSQEAPAQPLTLEDEPAPGARQSTTPSPAAADTPLAEQVEEEEPRRGGHLLLASMADIPHLDVHRSGQETLATLGPGLAYSRLLRLSAGPEVQQPSLTLECDLCESWELTSDMSYAFQLRSDVYWHDTAPVNGRQLREGELLANYLGSASGARDILEDNAIFYPPTLDIAVADLGPEYRGVADQMAQDLEYVGFDVNVMPIAPEVLQEKMFGQERDYQIALSPMPPHPTTNGYLYSVLHSRGPGNVSNHQDDVVNALIEAQAAELDPAKRQQRLLDLQRRVLDQAYMFSPITGSYRWVFDWDLQNFYPNTALSEYHYWSEAWLSQ
ncbi:MAG: hypothetical protein F4X65_06800 [Chloroflexi bacterium]|nr:hypothetical protein [Chloroflexota bacterium]